MSACHGTGDLQTHVGSTGVFVCTGCGMENPPLDDDGLVAEHPPIPPISSIDGET